MNMYVGVRLLGGFVIELSRILYVKYEFLVNGIIFFEKEGRI